MLRLIFIKVPVVFGLVVLLASAYLSWQSGRLVRDINQQDSVDVMREMIESDSFPALIVDPIKTLLSKASSQTNIDNKATIDLLNVYLERRPFDASAWLIASQFYQRNNELDLSAQALAVAHKLSEKNTPILLKVFNRYLELGLIDHAMPVAHDIVYARPSEFRRLFYLMGRLHDDYPLVVSGVIPTQVPRARSSQKQLEANAYYAWALADAIRTGNTSLAQAVWAEVPAQFKRNTKLGLRYINYLVDLQDPALLEPVWFDVVGQKMVVAELLNSGLAPSVSPCWQTIPVDGVESRLEMSANKFSLQLSFLGERNIAYSHLSCIVRVSPGEKYVLRGRSRGEGITTLSGPFLDVYYPSVDSSYRRTEAMIGTWHWADLHLVLDVPQGAHFAKIRIRRAKTELLDSKIFGHVWFENISLEKPL